jgi:CHAT domain
MNRRTSIINISGDFEESLLQLSRHLGTEKVRRALFGAVYGRGTKPRSKKQLMTAAKLGPEKSQQAQNALDHLARHHLISRTDNDGSVQDGSRNLYGKDETIRANRERIIRLADNPKLAERLPTKRRLQASTTSSVRTITRGDLRKRKKLVVLLLTSNSLPGQPLRVDAEVRRVQEAVRGSKFAENVQVEYRPAADLKSILDGLNDYQPQVVHFSGHGSKTDLVTDTGTVDAALANDKLSYSLLGQALAATDHPPQIVMLNSCWSSAARKVIPPSVDFLVSMSVPISDIAAAAFAPQFYAALASGQSVSSAFKQGAVAVSAASLSEAATPELHCNGADPAKTVLT